MIKNTLVSSLFGGVVMALVFILTPRTLVFLSLGAGVGSFAFLFTLAYLERAPLARRFVIAAGGFAAVSAGVWIAG